MLCEKQVCFLERNLTVANGAESGISLMNLNLTHCVVYAVLFAWLVGCSSSKTGGILPDKSVEYKREKQAERNLEVPPDLTSSTIGNSMSIPEAGGVTASYQDFMIQRGNTAGARQVGGGAVLPEIKDVVVKRDGDERWLVINAPPDTVWPRIVDFWQQNGILLQEQDPSVGVMVTAWIENRANIKSDFITNAVRSVFDGLYETSTRDQFRIRLERAQGVNATELYLTHFGMQETLPRDTVGEDNQAVWIQRERDPGLESVMLRRMMVFLGQAEERAQAQLAAQGGSGDQPRSRLRKTRAGTELLIDEGFARAWRVTGLALDRVGFAVEDRDRSDGTYYVRYNDPAARAKKEGWLSKLAFWSDDSKIDDKVRYRVKVDSSDQGSVVTVLNDTGQRDLSTTAERILTLLHEQIQ